MFRLLESIKIKDNRAYNLEYHNKRLNFSRKILYGCDDSIDLNDYIKTEDSINGLNKCRIICDEIVREVSVEPYNMRTIRNLKVVLDDEIDYTHKITDKEIFKKLLEKRNNCDDILIVKRNRVTDTSFSNVIFFDGTKYFTPSSPLLNGTKRQRLIDEKIIFEEDITINDIKKFKYIQFINAMIDIEDEKNVFIENIVF